MRVSSHSAYVAATCLWLCLFHLDAHQPVVSTELAQGSQAAEGNLPPAPASDSQASSVSATSLTGFIEPAQMIKLTLPPPDSSNRLEFNYFQPLNRWHDSILFFDNTVYARGRPLADSGQGLPAVVTWGESFRLGYRHLLVKRGGFVGINAGYDAAWQQGFFFQQLGVGLESVFQGFSAQATATHGIGASYSSALGQSLLSSVNLQASFPTGIPSISMATRFYYVYDQLGQSAPGGQLQVIYGINRFLSANVSISRDNLNGTGGALQFRYFFNPPKPQRVPTPLSYGVASAFSQAIGNTGSRIIRLTGYVPAYGD